MHMKPNKYRHVIKDDMQRALAIKRFNKTQNHNSKFITFNLCAF